MKRIQLLLVVCQFLIILSLEMSNPFLPLYVQSIVPGELSHIARLSSIIIAIPMLMMIITSPIWGMVADKYGYKPMLLRAALALTVCQSLMGFATQEWHLIVIRLLQGCFAGFIAAMQAYAVNLSEWQHKGKNLSRLQSAKALGTSVSGSLGGIIITYASIKSVFFISALLCGLSFILIYLYLPNVKKAPQKHQATTSTPMALNFTVIASLIVLSQIAKFIPNPTFALYVTQYISAKPIIIGILYSLPAISLILVSELSGRFFDGLRVNSPSRLSWYFISVGALGFGLMIMHALATTITSLICIRLLWGLVFACLLPALFALISDKAHKSGYYIGLANSLAKLGNLSGLLVGGFAAGLLPLNQLFLIAAMCYAFIAAIALFQSKLSFKDSISHE